MPRQLLLIVLLCTFAKTLPAAETSMWDSLSSQQQEQISASKPLLLEEEIPDNPWPRYTVYQLVNAPAEKAAAVFWDCELDPKYIPNCLSVHLVAKPDPWIHDGEYTLKMPMMLPAEIYVSRNELKLPSPGVYEISWNVLHARYITGSAGNIRIEPHGEKSDRSLIRYTNLVKPGSSIAGLLRTQAANQVVQSVKALARQIESEMETSPQIMDQQLQHLNRDLPSANSNSTPAGR